MAKGMRRRNRVSVQFGRWNIDGLPLDQDYLAKAEQMLAPYGPDGGSAYIKDGVGILFRAFHTTKESRKETQPYVTPSGAVLTWDGRLDNCEELVKELRGSVLTNETDLVIVAAAYEAWGTKCFAKLIGDWALSVWDPRGRSLILAKDPIGTRHLYYSSDEKQITWGSILDPLVLLAGKTLTLEEEYIAGWLSFFPAAHLTPYVGIHSIPPSCFIRLKPERETVNKYWDFDPSKKIRYPTDVEYEEHFRQVFGEAVRRRLRSDSPILAELSGGVDSSSIVCVADTIIARGVAETPCIDTISYYDDSEPNWNEKPYFTKVEERRGRAGCHIDVESRGGFNFETKTDRFAAAPGTGGFSDAASMKFAELVNARTYRILLSGFGGDEVMGGVPTPTPELADLFAEIELRKFTHQLRLWALSKRRPWFHLIFEILQEFVPTAFLKSRKCMNVTQWLRPGFVQRNQTVLKGYPARIRLSGPRPSFQTNLRTLEALRRQLSCSVLQSEPLLERRHPYLDRDLLEFIYAVSREQLVRPGQRRSLMRRALTGIVPAEVLNRKRKAYVVRTPLAALAAQGPNLVRKSSCMKCAALGIVNRQRLAHALLLLDQGREVPLVPLLRTFTVEWWLRNLGERGIWADSDASRMALPARPERIEFSAEEN
jgi:asparagine synthase (glutamine-hydrolysing)